MKTPPPIKPEPPQTACGGLLPDPAGYPAEDYRGRRVYFCLEACRRAFLRDPDRFLAGEVPHPLTETD